MLSQANKNFKRSHFWHYWYFK